MTILLYELVGADPARPFSPHCWKAAMALAHKGLAFKSMPTPFTSVPTVEASYSKTVPVIRDGEKLVTDSFVIARYLEETYPDRPSLFGGPGGMAMARFVERWTQLTVQAQMMGFIVLDIHDCLGPVDRAYFRASRETRLGRALEAVVDGREARLGAFRAAIEPLRSMLGYQPFIGGEAPLFCDYIVFGAFQWARVTSPFALLAADDPVAAWFERCLDLHGGLGRSVAAAA
jgi:glutathione S-transferase